MEKRSQNEQYRQYLSARMNAWNPMYNPESREKMRQSILQLIDQHVLQPYGGRLHGNGMPMTSAEAIFAAMYPQAEYQASFATGMGKDGYPHAYKPDFTFHEEKMVVEIDGSSHSQDRKDTDMRKQRWFESQGWGVMRIANVALTETPEVVESVLSQFGITPAMSTTSKSGDTTTT